jgi:hypothetical protein
MTSLGVNKLRKRDNVVFFRESLDERMSICKPPLIVYIPRDVIQAIDLFMVIIMFGLLGRRAGRQAGTKADVMASSQSGRQSYWKYLHVIKTRDISRDGCKLNDLWASDFRSCCFYSVSMNSDRSWNEAYTAVCHLRWKRKIQGSNKILVGKLSRTQTYSPQ